MPGTAWHDAGVSVNPSALHNDGPLTVKASEAHNGWQELPAAKLLVQSPTSPLAGAVDASHVFA
jgi:hypothetical protein